MYNIKPIMEYDEYYCFTEEEIEVLKKIEKVEEALGTEQFLQKYEDRILALKNPLLSYKLIEINGSKEEEHRKIVLNGRNGKYNLLLLKRYYLEPIKHNRHLLALLQSNDAKYLYYMYKNTMLHNKSAELIVENGDPRANILLFCDKFQYKRKSIKFDVQKNRQNILNSNNPTYNYRYAEYLTRMKINEDYKDLFGYKTISDDEIFELVKEHADVVINSEDKDLVCCNWFMRHLLNFYDTNNKEVIECINSFANIILKSNSIRDQIECASILDSFKYDKFDIKKFEDAVIQSKDIDNCITYAKKVKSVDLTRIEDVILETKDPDYCIKYVSEFPTRRIRDFARVVIYNGELEQMEAFFKQGKDAIYLTIEKEFEAFSYLYSLTMNENIIQDRINYLSNKENISPRVKRECMAVLKSNLNEQLESIVDPEEEFEALLSTMTINKGNSTKK